MTLQQSHVSKIAAASLLLAGLLLLPYFYHGAQINIASIQNIHQLPAQVWSKTFAETINVNREEIDSIYSSILNNRLTSTCGTTAVCDEVQPAPLRSSELLAIAKVALAEGKYLEAGEAYARAGIFDFLVQSSGAGTQYGLTAAEGVEVGKSLLAFMESRFASLTVEEIANYARTIRNLAGKESDLVAKTFDVEARSAADRNTWQAFQLIRMSLDVQPPESLMDKRLTQFYDYATNIALEHRCTYTNEKAPAFLAAIYGDASMRSTSDCLDTLVETTTPYLAAPLQGYLPLRRAIWNLSGGRAGDALPDLDLAEQLGVPAAWRNVLLSGEDAVEQADTMPPTYALDDIVYAGFEIDPIQVALGIPLDVLLYRKPPTPEQPVQLVLHTSPNLAPNPGFEYGLSGADCGPLLCTLTSYEFDMYGPEGAELSPETHQVVLVERPSTPAPVAPPMWSNTLSLDNRSTSIQGTSSSSLVSYARSVDDKKRYLQAGWIRSESGNAFLGHEWADAQQRRYHEYVASDPDNLNWQHFSGVYAPGAGATTVRLWLLNFDAPGLVEFDDLIFVELPE